VAKAIAFGTCTVSAAHDVCNREVWTFVVSVSFLARLSAKHVIQIVELRLWFAATVFVFWFLFGIRTNSPPFLIRVDFLL
jgi:hypothetical protein